MAKWKTKVGSRRRGPKRPSRKLLREISAAMELFEDGEIADARRQLIQLAKRNPRNKQVLLALLELTESTKDWYTYAYYSEQLIPLEKGLDQAEILNNLIFAYSQLLYPALTWHYAKMLTAEHPDFEYIDQVKELKKETGIYLLEEMDKIILASELTQAEKFDLLVKHDRVRFFTESGHPAESIPIAQAMLEKVPDTIPILNNLSLSQFAVGDVDQAIETAGKVLAIDPENFHALGNLVRYNFLTGQFDQAQAYARRLEQITGDKPDLETKQAEAFAYLGEDEKIKAAYERMQAKGNEMNLLLLHLAATAYYRLGNEKQAWKLWRQAVKMSPSFELAQESLAEQALPVGERDVPWYWSFGYWFPQDFGQFFIKHLGSDVRRQSEKAVGRSMNALLAERPYLSELFPHMLEYGDRETREFVINFIRIVKTPELLQILLDFAHDRYGADDLRLEAMQIITENKPEMLPEDKRVTMWINGKQTELVMLGFEITDEPELVEGISEEIQDKHKIAYELLMEDDPEAAEALLQEIIDEAPEFYTAYNQLAVAYQMQGKHEQARALVEKTHALFPDYLFARVGLARLLIQDKQTEEAKALLEPLMRLQKLHFSEFRALAGAHIELALAEKQPEAARMWLEMWEQIDEDDPDLFNWQMRVRGPGLFEGLKSIFKGSQF